MYWFILLCYILLVTLGSSQAATYYVATTGDDSRSCVTAENILTPKQTIANTVSNCLGSGVGHNINIRAGTYTERFTVFDKSGTAASHIVIQGHPGDARPVIRPGSGLNDHAITTDSSGSQFLAAYIDFKNFDVDGINLSLDTDCISINTDYTTIDNVACTDAARNGFKFFASNGAVRNSTVTNCGRNPTMDVDTKGLGIYVNYSNNVFEYNTITGCRAGGIIVQFNSPANNIVRNNTVKNAGISSPLTPPGGFTIQSGTCVNVGQDASNTQVYNNVCAHIRADPAGGNADGVCIFLWGGATNSSVWNNTCYDADKGIWGNGGATFTGEARNSLLSNVTTPTLGGLTTMTNTLSNPVVGDTFVNAAADDFHLKAGSPAIDAGVTVSIVTLDRDNVARPQGGTYDIGAYESVATPPVINRGTFECTVDTEFVAGTSYTTDYSQSTGNITNGTTEMQAFTGFAIQNGVVGAAPVVTQGACRCEDPFHSESNVIPTIGGCQVTPGGYIQVVAPLTITTAGLPESAFSWYASVDGGAFSALDADFGGRRARFMPNSDTPNLTAINRAIGGCILEAAPNRGVMYTGTGTFPAVVVGVDKCITYGLHLRFDPAATVGQVIELQLDTVTPSVVHPVANKCQVTIVAGSGIGF